MGRGKTYVIQYDSCHTATNVLEDGLPSGIVIVVLEGWTLPCLAGWDALLIWNMSYRVESNSRSQSLP